MGDLCWSSLCLKVCIPWKGHTPEQFLKSYGPWEGLTLDKFIVDSVLLEGLHTAAGEECEEEGAAQRKCHGLTTTPVLHSPPLNRERQGCRRVRKEEVKLSLGNRREWEQGVFSCIFSSHYPALFLICNKLNVFPRSVFPVMVTGKGSVCLYLDL